MLPGRNVLSTMRQAHASRATHPGGWNAFAITMTDKIDITLNINGRDHTVAVEPRKTLVDAIRDDCGQTGTHIGCEHGVCGACTVIVGDEAVRSCLMFAVQAQGKRIRTVEGLAEGDSCIRCSAPSCASRAAMRLLHAWLSDACRNVLENNPTSATRICSTCSSSNLCRCTGYQNIIKAVRSTADEMRGARASEASG